MVLYGRVCEFPKISDISEQDNICLFIPISPTHLRNKEVVTGT